MNAQHEQGDHFGTALTVGDFDGDSIDDLALSIPDESTSTLERTGFVWVLWGVREQGLVSPTAAAVRPARYWWQGSDGSVGGVAETGDRTGSSLSALDANGDGLSDLFVGAAGERGDGVGGGHDREATGGLGAVGGDAELGFADTSYMWVEGFFASAKPVVPSQIFSAAFEEFASTLFSSGLGTPIGTVDRAVFAGTPGEDASRGAVYMLFYRGNEELEEPSRMAVLGGERAEPTRFGASLALFEHTLFVGAPAEGQAAGRVYRADLDVLESFPEVWPALDAFGAPTARDRFPDGASFGHALAIQKGAAASYLLVGAPGNIVDGACQRGAVYRYTLPGLELADVTTVSGSALLGWAVAAADLDGDGDQEAVATAPGAEPGQLTVWE